MALFDELFKLYDDLQTDILREIADRTARNPEKDIDEWHARMLSQTGMMRKSVLKKLSKITKRAPPDIERMFVKYGLGVFHKDEKAYKYAASKGFFGGAPLPKYSGKIFEKIINSGIKGCYDRLNLVHTTAEQSSQEAFRSVVNRVYVSSSLGGKSFSEAAQEALRALADRGISGVTYRAPSGRIIRQTIDVAVRRMVATSYEQMGGDVQMQMAKDWKNNFVETSSHMGARPSHAVWQGQTFQLDGDDRYPNFYTECKYGEGDGIKGYNCHHDFYPFFPGLSTRAFPHYDEKKNAEQYAQEQKQRGYEQQIRKYKRRRDTADAAGQAEASEQAQGKVRQYQKMQREHVKKYNLERDYSREK